LAAVENARAAARADEAAVEYARVRLGYCTIRSPLDGRTGSLIVQQGNLIKAEDISLVVINQVTPIYVVFSIPEQVLAQVRKFMAAGTLKVSALPAQDGDQAEEGVITFVDNAVDSTTGTIRLRGTYLNKERKLWPGQFVQVVLTLSNQPNAIVVPSQAVQTGQAGQYLFVVKPDLTVESRPVVAGRIFNGETVIEKGVNAGEKVVTDGQLRLFPGAKVEIKNGNLDPESKENGR
jgi:multidrug efflux system membrane fusion protein